MRGHWVSAAVVLALSGAGAGLIAAGTKGLGILVIVMGVAQLAQALVASYASERSLFTAFLIRPFFLGGWFLALAGVAMAAHTSEDWIVVAAFGGLYVGLGAFYLVAVRAGKRRGRRPPPLDG